MADRFQDLPAGVATGTCIIPFSDLTTTKKSLWSNMPGFEIDYVEITGNVSITQTTEDTANTVITGNSVSYDGSTPVVIEFYAQQARPDTTAVARSQTYALYEDGASIGQIGSSATPSNSSDNKPTILKRRMTPSAG